ncbi:MAG: bifunctional folylpolyglutamate synthase/dihydrofolate synthase [Rhabdochlamydiaceae bacterium]|nr:bifunctional folylpolyglutamate synthase/dihydrofolate synthase [Rhabdochlamydiaceae bacterium]
MGVETLLHELFSKLTRQIPKDQVCLDSIFQSLGHPELCYPTVHVAGTNGKGSVTTKIAKTLELAGYQVGLFTSPHIHNFAERIQINGVKISDDDIEKFLTPLLKRFPEYCFFDFTTFLAFQYFHEQKVDLAVIETGIGGLYDTTNVVSPLVSVITSIGLDHVELLGSTLEEIAFQKAGIIKPGVPVVIGPKARYQPIYQQAQAQKSPLIEVSAKPGGYDLENQAIARAAIEQLRPYFSISDQNIEMGLLATPPCRFERHGRFVLDVAHNEEGFKELIKTWNYQYPGKKFVAIVGLSADKDLEQCLEIIAASADHLFLVSADSKRAATTQKLKEILLVKKISHFTECESIEKAIETALAGDHDILICGSFYIMKQVREQIFGLQVS